MVFPAPAASPASPYLLKLAYFGSLSLPGAAAVAFRTKNKQVEEEMRLMKLDYIIFPLTVV